MSQLPPPYSFPYGHAPIDFSHYQMPGHDYLRPARRAGVLQAVLGGLVLACGICFGSLFWVVDIGEAAAHANVNIQELTRGQSVEMLRITYTVMGAVGSAIGVGLLVLAVFVRRGGLPPVIASIVLSSLVTVFLALQVVGAFVLGLGNPAAAIMTVLVIAVPIGLFALNVVWLVAAARNSRHVTAAMQQYQSQFYQYQQQQQAYGYGGIYGTGQPQQGYGYSPAASQQQFGQPPQITPGPSSEGTSGVSGDQRGSSPGSQDQ